MSNLTSASAHQLAQMIRDRKVSAVEVLDAYLAQISKHNSKLNAICTLDEDNARAGAKLADEALARGEHWGALHSVPITVKDIFETAGLRTTAGYIPLKDYIPQQDEFTGVDLTSSIHSNSFADKDYAIYRANLTRPSILNNNLKMVTNRYV